MARWRGTSTQRGYGHSHKTERDRLAALFRPGQPCAECGYPMAGPVDQLDLAHDHVNGGYKGLAHARCNRAEGAARSGTARTMLAAGHDVLCTTCGQPYHYKPRSCEICGKHYHPNHKDQRSCGRVCGTEIARRNRVARGWLPAAQRPKPARRPNPPREPKNGWPCTPIRIWACKYCSKQGTSNANRPQERIVCDDRKCQLLRLRANNWRVRYGLTQDEADAAVLAQLRPGIQQRPHNCPACGTPAPASFRWCDQCLCASRNAKGRRCGNRAGDGGLCDYHASTGEVAAAS